MLAKQGWRLVNNDNPLVTTCLKARYFLDGDFLTARLGANPSYMWRSIFATQELIKRGCRRRIGNDNDTKIWKVPWLSCIDNGFLSSHMPMELANSNVSSLMEIGQNRWDADILNDLCNDRDKQLIQRVPIPSKNKPDSWFWLLDDKGIFTMKSCYRLIQGEMETPHARFWRKMWSLKLPGKIINFLWRVCKLCLPTAVRLSSRSVQIDTVCQWCHIGQESDMHVLFECAFADAVWTDIGLKQFMDILPSDTIFDLFRRVFARCNREQCGLMGLICWSMWNRRNKWIWVKVNMSVFGVKANALNLLTAWKKAQVTNMKPNGIPSA